MAITLQTDSEIQPMLDVQGARDINARTTGDIADMRQFLPDNPTNVIDLGCGSGRVSIGLAQTFPQWQAKYWLVDGEATGPLVKDWARYNDRVVRFCNKAALTARMCQLNQFTNYEYINIGNDFSWPKFPDKAELLYSQNAFGFHYPIMFYKDVYPKILLPGAICIFHARLLMDTLPPYFTKIGAVEKCSYYDKQSLLVVKYTPVS
jgi:SAM-dependent methyltransferase